MERLTFKNGDYVWCVDNDNCFEEQSENYCGPAIDRLAHYEDLDDRGLVCDFPACVGDTVYLVYGYAGNPKMHEGEITMIESCSKNEWEAQAYFKNYGGITIYSDNFGRSVFKPDEAQKAYDLIKNSPCDSAEIQKFGSDLGYMCEFTNERTEYKQCELCIHRWRNNE